MGTRHIIAVFLDGEFKVAQYGQWDGYPTGQGVDITKFIKEQMDLEKFKTAVRECRFISAEEATDIWKAAGADESGWVSLDISKKVEAEHPELVRETSAKILGLIQNHGVRGLRNEIDFVRDSLFCEWAYVVDLDREILEIYTGFQKNKEALTGRFKDLPLDSDYEGRETPYYAISLRKEIPFAELSKEAMVLIEKEDREAEEAAEEA